MYVYIVLKCALLSKAGVCCGQLQQNEIKNDYKIWMKLCCNFFGP